MVEIKVTGNTPLEALASLTAFRMHCMQNADVYAAASRILEAEKHEEEKKKTAAQPPKEPSAQSAPEAPNPPAEKTPKEAKKKPSTDAPKEAAPEPTEAPDTPEDAPPTGDTTPPEKPAQDVTAPSDADVRAALNDLLKNDRRDAVKKILKGFGASNFSGLAKENYAAAIEAARSYLAMTDKDYKEAIKK